MPSLRRSAVVAQVADGHTRQTAPLRQKRVKPRILCSFHTPRSSVNNLSSLPSVVVQGKHEVTWHVVVDGQQSAQSATNLGSILHKGKRNEQPAAQKMARWYQRQQHRAREGYTPTLVSSLSLREEEEEIWGPAEVRRWRFIASDPPAALPPMRLVGDNREPDNPLGIALVVEDLGRVPEAANFGNEAPLREALCGVPDARFLPNGQ